MKWLKLVKRLKYLLALFFSLVALYLTEPVNQLWFENSIKTTYSIIENPLNNIPSRDSSEYHLKLKVLSKELKTRSVTDILIDSLVQNESYNKTRLNILLKKELLGITSKLNKITNDKHGVFIDEYDKLSKENYLITRSSIINFKLLNKDKKAKSLSEIQIAYVNNDDFNSQINEHNFKDLIRISHSNLFLKEHRFYTVENVKSKKIEGKYSKFVLRVKWNNPIKIKNEELVSIYFLMPGIDKNEFPDKNLLQEIIEKESKAYVDDDFELLFEKEKEIDPPVTSLINISTIVFMSVMLLSIQVFYFFETREKKANNTTPVSSTKEVS